MPVCGSIATWVVHPEKKTSPRVEMREKIKAFNFIIFDAIELLQFVQSEA
jgi:hypothetical protein